MKRLLALTCLLTSNLAWSQVGPHEIKKYKISKITKAYTTSDDSGGVKYETFYDRNGNDTAEYIFDGLYKRSDYEYDLRARIIRRRSYRQDGSEIETAVYDYRPDGSYTISNTDSVFQLTDKTYFDRHGRITRTVSPDSTERIYMYDSGGRLLKIRSGPGGNGITTDLQYSYNKKGQCSKELSRGKYKWTRTFEYDAKGLLTKAITHSTEEGDNTKATDTYQYEFRR